MNTVEIADRWNNITFSITEFGLVIEFPGNDVFRNCVDYDRDFKLEMQTKFQDALRHKIPAVISDPSYHTEYVFIVGALVTNFEVIVDNEVILDTEFFTGEILTMLGIDVFASMEHIHTEEICLN